MTDIGSNYWAFIFYVWNQRVKLYEAYVLMTIRILSHKTGDILSRILMCSVWAQPTLCEYKLNDTHKHGIS